MLHAKLYFWCVWFFKLRHIVSIKTARSLVRQWHPTERCHCGYPTKPRLAGATRLWECQWGGCGYGRYEEVK